MKQTIRDVLMNSKHKPFINLDDLDFCIVFDERNQLLSSPDDVEVHFGHVFISNDILDLHAIFFDVFSKDSPTFSDKFVPLLKNSPAGTEILNKITRFDTILVISAKKE